ncbi:hypothetical protein PV11_08387 [Exophiala sideris]|uniref:Uncharacterized protein n=1 Tax=Exophiala sideris TaxID=1016849 RepID=A0A0D1YD87_9EURO|nr:hypothetical protein PV11_08387 [Exophiala sideris]
MTEHNIPIPAELKELGHVSTHTESSKIEMRGIGDFLEHALAAIGGERIERTPAFDTLYKREGLRTRTKTLTKKHGTHALVLKYRWVNDDLLSQSSATRGFGRCGLLCEGPTMFE